MYSIISLIVGLIFAFSTSSILSFLPAFIFASIIAFVLLTYFDTVLSEENKNPAFLYADNLYDTLSEKKWTWAIFLLPALVWFFFGVVCALIIAPFFYLESLNDERSLKIRVYALLSLTGIMVIFAVILFVSPMAAYKIMHYGWYIALYVLCPIIIAVMSANLRENNINDTEKKITKWILTLNIAFIPLMIIGLLISRNATYMLNSADDMRVLANAPVNYNTLFVLENDIDFTDEDVSWYGKRKNFSGVFDGQGYTLSNITVDAKCRNIKLDNATAPQGLGFVRVNTGVIKNLNFEDCRFIVQNKKSRRDGYNMYFGIIAAYNDRGKIYNCNVIDCQAKYTSDSEVAPVVSLSVPAIISGEYNTYVTDVNVSYVDGGDASFYDDVRKKSYAKSDFIYWYKVD